MRDAQAPGAAETRRSRLQHLRLGCGLGLGLGAVGQTIVAARAERDAQPLLFYVAVALSVAGGYGLLALGLGEASRWLERGRRSFRILSAAKATALGGLAAFHMAGIGVRALSGDYPSFAALQMLAESPVQFVSQALSGYRLHLIATGLLFAVVASLLYLRLSRGGKPAPSTPAAATASTAVVGLTWLLSLGVVYATSPNDFTHATPELAALASSGLNPDLAKQRAARRAPAHGASRTLHEDWLRTVSQHKGPRPNVILLVLESVPYDAVGFGGYPRDVTPNLDALARRALRMRRAWSVATQSNYAQMAILSSLHPRRRARLDQYEELDYPRVLPHDVFAALGYTTATFSSQNESWQGMRRFQDTGTQTTFRDASSHPGPHIGSGLERKLPDHLTTDAAVQWLEQQGDRPFELYLNFQRTHFPYELPEGFTPAFEPSAVEEDDFGFLYYPRSQVEHVRNRFDSALRYVDAQVGRIVRFLEEHGELDDTLWVVTADHGELFHEHGLVTHGKSLFDREARVPLFVHWPARLPASDSDVPVSTLDIMPTVLELIGLPPHPSYQGTSFADRSARARDRRGIFLTLQGLRYADAVLCWPFKLIHESSHGRLLLFDVGRDPNERHNLLDREPARARLLGAVLLSHVQRQLAYHADTTAQAAYFAPPLGSCPP